MLRWAKLSPLIFPVCTSSQNSQSLHHQRLHLSRSSPLDLLIFSQVALVSALLASREAHPEVEIKYGSISASPAPSKRIRASPSTTGCVNGKKEMTFWSRRLPLCLLRGSEQQGRRREALAPSTQSFPLKRPLGASTQCTLSGAAARVGGHESTIEASGRDLICPRNCPSSLSGAPSPAFLLSCCSPFYCRNVGTLWRWK